MHISPSTSSLHSPYLRNGKAKHPTPQQDAPMGLTVPPVPTVQITPQWQDSKAFRLGCRTALFAGIGALIGCFTRSIHESHSLGASIGAGIGAGIGLLWGALVSHNMKSAEALARERYEADQRVQLLSTGQTSQYQAIPVLSAGVHAEGSSMRPYFVRNEPLEIYNHGGSGELFSNMLLLSMIGNHGYGSETHHYYYPNGGYGARRNWARDRRDASPNSFFRNPWASSNRSRGLSTPRLSSSSNFGSASSRSSSRK